MEVEVRVVAGVEGCFVSLPLFLIQTLQRGLERENGGALLPPILGLELKSVAEDGRKWFLAWSHSPSRSSFVEVPQRLAECISLPDKTKVKLKAIPELSKAVSVNIEPATEEDWEILESRPGSAEEVMLTQVGVLYEGMKFPLWLYEHVVVEFIVISCSPNKPLVQLKPGSEIVVAPKTRLKPPSTPSPQIEQTKSKALLRVQADNHKHVHQFNFKGHELRVSLTSCVFIHPETATNKGFGNFEFGTVSANVVRKDGSSNGKGQVSITKKGLNSNLNSRERNRHIVVRIIYSSSVAKSHLMIPQPIRHFIRADIHAWVYMEKYIFSSKKGSPVLTISPLQFRLARKNKPEESTDFDLHDREKNSTYPNNSNMALNLIEDFMALHFKEEGLLKEFLIKSWLVGQIKAITSENDEKDARTFLFANESLLHFEVLDHKFGNEKMDLMYLLSVQFEGADGVGSNENFETMLETDVTNLENFDSKLWKFESGDPVFLETFSERNLNEGFELDASSLSWIEAAISDVIKRLFVLLSPFCRKLLNKLVSSLPGNVLIHGPPGSGKTTLCRAVAKHMQEHLEILAHIVYIDCSKLEENGTKIRQSISDYLSDALIHAPSVVIFDNLDEIISNPSDSAEGRSEASNSFTKYLAELIDEYKEKSGSRCGYGYVAFVATAQNLANLPQALTSSGRFDFHVQLATPAVSERLGVLRHEVHKRSLQCSDEVLYETAFECDGYDAHDLEALVVRAEVAAIPRPSLSPQHHKYGKITLVKDDFSKAMNGFQPVGMRGISKASSDVRNAGWDGVGGLAETRNAIQETIELPSKFPNIFSQSPLRLRSNILLYGPPGCGKTHIVGAAATASNLRFISVKGPELLNKYIGASEQAVRDIFSKAAAAAPCLLFFDEFDSIAPKRGHDNTGVTDRVVNQLLTELDGVETLNGVFVFAATSRPDLLDAALLRPGRFDRLLFCDFPQWRDRLDILAVLSKKLPLSSDVILEDIASVTDGFSGADLQALLSDAQLAAVNKIVDSQEGSSSSSGSSPMITDSLLKSVASKARPSISESEKKRLYDIYTQFMDSKKSLSAQMRDAKGKRATLA
ncbi:hypothetical protein LUZ62_063044 [Rhynchospora pubera]|uniref:Peroxisomal ATPase PEX1 n=1 Tax=Rhynchospora pubera TaxID=906938 RepID=A0AAV8EKU0_9POAL|nr:hypothetical protein LUZ62_057593 [Rhynchospora pubera]KAJ4778787.1 hypothetical protein LUZ62_063044 [Rhynchospora pubera]